MSVSAQSPTPPPAAAPTAVSAASVPVSKAAPRANWPLWIGLCLLLAVAQMALAGYTIGVGNQTIQIPFLKFFMDPSLFGGDAMVRDTIRDYPSFFYRGLALITPALGGVTSAFFILHVLTTWMVLLGVFALCRTIFNHWAPGLAAILLLLAGHHHALAGDELYSIGFTHTWAVFPLAIFTLLLMYRQHIIWALVLAGIIFNLHALTAAYLAFMIGVVALLEPIVRGMSWSPEKPADGDSDLPAAKNPTFLSSIFSLFFGGFLFLLIASPTLYMMATNHQVYSAQWFDLTYLRSADHSFPASWWKPDAPDVPRFALILGLATIGLSLTPPTPAALAARRKTLLFALAIGILFAAGYVFTQVWPLASVVRAQLYRSSRLLMVIAFCQIGWAIVYPFLGPRSTNAPAAPLRKRLPETLAALITLAVLAFPPLLPLLPWAFALCVLVAISSGRLSMFQAVICGAILLLCVAAVLQIHLSLPFVNDLLPPLRAPQLSWVFWVCAAAAAVFVSLAALPLPKWLAAILALIPAGLAIALAFPLYQADAALNAADPFVMAQDWARTHTAKDALFLTPTKPGGFRMFSDRAIVAEWRDGTQLYFNAAFADKWFKRIADLQPGLELSPDGRRIVSKEKAIDDLDDGQLIALAKKYEADYILLPLAKGRTGATHHLKSAYVNDQWGIFYPTPAGAADVAPQARTLPPAPAPANPRIAASALAIDTPPRPSTFPAPPAPLPKISAAPTRIVLSSATHPSASQPRPTAQVAATGPQTNVPRDAINPAEWVAAEHFMDTTVQANIDKYRKRDVVIHILDPTGKPVTGLTWEARQTRQAFAFSASLPFFKVPAGPSNGDYKPPKPVDARELSRVLDVFNASLIPFSAKWMYTEPSQGKYDWEDMDRYAEWGQENNIPLEWHFISGYAPRWVGNVPINQLKAVVVQHTHDVMTRYRDKITWWQVQNEHEYEQYAVDMFKEARSIKPDAKLGLAFCQQMWDSPTRFSAGQFTEGLDSLRMLKAKGLKIDFFATHAHKPFGLWADPRTIYSALDLFALEGVKIHMTEFFVPVPSSIIGPMRRGTWTPELQADYYVRMFKIAYSHPAVELINIWGIGPETWREGSGLLNPDFSPKPAYTALKDLIDNQFHTQTNGTLAQGQIAFRGFQGDYELTLHLANGSKATATFALPMPDMPAAVTSITKINAAPVELTFQLDPSTGALSPS